MNESEVTGHSGYTTPSKNAKQKGIPYIVAELSQLAQISKTQQEQHIDCPERNNETYTASFSSGVALDVSIKARESSGNDLHMIEQTSSSDQDPEEQPPVTQKVAWYQMPLVTRNVAPDPKLLPHSHKYLILLTVSVAGCLSPMATTIYLPALIDMQEAFDTSDTAMNASLALFIFVTAFFPLIWAAFGDAIGRRPIYLISIFIAVIANVGCALSTNVVMLIVFRAVTGIGSSSVMSMGAGSISDIFEAEERGRAFAYYTTGPMLGPALAPIIGGYLNLAFGWQSNFWFLAIAFFCVWLGILCFLPETWRPKASPQASVKSGRASRKTKKASVRVINPLVAVKLLRYPNVVLVVLFSGFLFFTSYVVSANFSRIYTEQYKLDTGTVGLCYLPQAIGSIVGGNTGGRLSDKTYKRRIHSVDKSKIYPEMRINGPFLYFAFVLQLFAQIAYGWCIQMNVHYAVGLVCLFFVGASRMLPNVTLSAYLVDCFRDQSATVTACNNFVRYVFGGVGSLIAADFQSAVQPGILYTLCGAIFFTCCINVYLLQRRGRVRQKALSDEMA